MRSEHDTNGITIVSGLPRSGTSLMMQMLHAGGLEPLSDHVREPDSDNPKGYYELEAVKRTKQDASWLELAEGKTVKMAHLLLYDLPSGRDYRVIFMRRELAEVVASQAVMLRRLGRAGADLSEEQLIRAYQRQIQDVECWLEERPNFTLLRVSYNELLREPVVVIDSIDRFLGGGLNLEAMREAIDPSLYRQRRGG